MLLRKRITRMCAVASTATLLCAGSSFAQTPRPPVERSYVLGATGFSTDSDGTSADSRFELGGRVARNLFVFGDIGRFHNLESTAMQQTVDTTTGQLSDNGISVTGSAETPTNYMLGGLRATVPTHSRVAPYAFGAVGFAHVMPGATFTYTSGALPDGSMPNPGDDVTTDLTSSGLYTPPSSTNSAMYSLGGGVNLPIAKHLAADVGYRYSRIATATPINTQGMTFGVGYRF